MGDGAASRKLAAEDARALALKLWVVLSRAQGAVAAHARADVARHGLTLAEFAVLEALYHKGPMFLSEVQQKILVSSGGITYVVDRLEAKGLVERRRCEHDRRAYYAALTARGEALVGQIFPEHAECLERALAGLDDGEKGAALRLLRKLGRAAAELTPGPVVERDAGGGG
ncbi:MAG: MarR family transcriptional regulator [Gemmatimonadetes bacterium]|nr:MarR family transcriptional regulator [Gemmatimonadota bacterium]